MSIGYDIGFTKKPEQSEIDSFMKSLGFEIETSKKRTGNYTRVYILNNKSVPREIELFYKEEAKNQREFFRERAGEIQSYGCLKTYSTEEAHPDLEDKLRIIEEKK